MEEKDEDRLKAVFEVCDQNHNGYISVEHFKTLVTDHFGPSSEQEVVSIVQLLDPAGKGKISFPDFCEGVHQITQALHLSHPRTLSVDSLSSLGSTTPTSTADPFSFSVSTESQKSQKDLNIFDLEARDKTPNGSALVISKLSLLPHSNQLGQTQPPGEDDHDSALSGRSSELNENSRTDITDEENFEDYGESEADITVASDLSDNGSRRITSAAFARKLHRRDSLESGDEFIGVIDGDIADLNDKVQSLSEQIQDLTKNQSDSHSRFISQKDENTSLVRKIHGLEEQIREMEFRSDEKLQDEQHRHREYILRQDNEKLEKLEYLTDRLQKAESECEAAQALSLRLQGDVDKLKQEKHGLQERLSEVLEENTSLREDQDLLLNKCQTQRQDFEQERLGSAGLLDELGKELDDLRKYKIEVERQHRNHPGLAELPAKYQEMQQEMHHLKEENRVLTSLNEDLNAQLISECMEEGRTLLMNTSDVSWAQEMDNMDANELKDTLKEQQDVNRRLKLYVDKMLLTILEKQPSLLEVTH